MYLSVVLDFFVMKYFFLYIKDSLLVLEFILLYDLLG